MVDYLVLVIASPIYLLLALVVAIEASIRVKTPQASAASGERNGSPESVDQEYQQTKIPAKITMFQSQEQDIDDSAPEARPSQTVRAQRR